MYHLLFFLCAARELVRNDGSFAVTRLDIHILIHSTNQECLPKLQAIEMEEECMIKKM